MDASPFREFLGGSTYNTMDDLLDDAATGGAASHFITFFLDVRQAERSRRTIGDFIQQWNLVKMGFPASKWYHPFCQKAFNCWRLLHLRCVPRHKRPLDDTDCLSRSVRRNMSQQGICKYSSPSIK